MRQSIKLFFLLLLLGGYLSCSAFSQAVSLPANSVSLHDKNLQQSHPFAVGTKALQVDIDATIAKALEDLNTFEDVLTDSKYVSFSPESGLYSGFGTAWYRKYRISFGSNDSLDILNRHCDFFNPSFTAKEDLELTLFKPDLQVAVGFYNSF